MLTADKKSMPLPPSSDGADRTLSTPDEGSSGPSDGRAAPPSSSLHDLLSSGEIVAALSSYKYSPTADEDDHGEGSLSKGKGRGGGGGENDDDGLGVRLPLLLRWLSVAQPLATTIPPPSSDRNENGNDFPVPDAIVPLLEEAAAAHPDAENVEVLASSLAPSICREAMGGRQQQLAPLSRNKTERSFLQLQRRTRGASPGAREDEDASTTWDTKRLDAVLERLANPTVVDDRPHKRKKEEHDEPGDRKRQKKAKSAAAAAADPLLEKMKMVIDLLEENDDDADSPRDSKETTRTPDDEAPEPSSFLARASSAANGDSHESAMRRVLQELVGLVKSSLLTGGSREDAGGAVEGEGGEAAAGLRGGVAEPGVVFSRSDSLFAEADEVSSSIGGGWSRLSVMVPVLMQHAPILRHEHIANALCRAAAPQAPALIMRMGANCPSATRNLLRGCVAAYQTAEQYESSASTSAGSAAEEGDRKESNPSNVRDILRTAVESANRLASLSRREALSAIRVIREERVMDGLVLSLSMQHDPIGAASFMVEKLSSPPLMPGATVHAANETSYGKRPKRRRAVPLRERMRNGRSYGGGRAPAKMATVGGKTARPRLCRELVEDKALAENTRRFISQRIIRLMKTNQNGAVVNLGEASLFVQAHALLIQNIGIGAGSSTGSGSKLVEDTMNAIQRLFGEAGPVEELPTLSSKDGIYKVLICAAIVTCCKYPPIADTDNDSVVGGPAAKACLGCLRGLLLHPTSVDTVVFSSRLAGLIMRGDATNLRAAFLENISPHNEEEDVSQMGNICRWLSSELLEIGKLKSIHDKGLAISSLVHDPIVVVEAMRESSSQTADELDNLMKNIFADPDTCTMIIEHHRVSSLVQENVNMLLRRPAPHIPMVLPLSLERLAQSVQWDKVGAHDKLTRKSLSQFVLQLVYALHFLDSQPLSPFVINPRLFPLSKSLAFLDSCEKKSKSKHCGFGILQVTLKQLVSKHCPDILHAMFNDSHFSQGHDNLIVNRRSDVKPMMVRQAILDCLKSGGSVDPSGLRAEEMFMICRSTYPYSEVDVAAVRAILAAGNSQPKFYSYVALCKDPLVLLKASAAIWKYRGMRCIMVRILQALMNANEVIAMQSSVSERVASEYLTARDVIIFRSIVFACASGFVFGTCDTGETPRSRHCMMCVNMIRSIVSKRRGIIAALIKQGLQDICIDWIVEFVPESISDAPIITSLLYDVGSLTATERLTAACAGLRIAVAHNVRGGSIANTLVSASTTVLLESFTLVIGPIGVPVSILREENGEDVTNICREKMFLMIKALSSISPKNKDLKNEASITLSKIATLCKSENAVGGVSGVAVSKRKALLKEIWDACVQANTALGGAMQL